MNNRLLNNPVSYRPPFKGDVPERFHPQMAEVARLRQLWEERAADAETARLEAEQAPAKYQAAVKAAVLSGRNPDNVDDPRETLKVKAERAAEDKKITEEGLGIAWATLVMALSEDAEQIRAGYRDELEALQAEAQAALAAYLRVRNQLRDRIGLDQWMRRTGQRRGVPKPPIGGPQPWQPQQIQWIDRLGRSHSLDARDLLAAMEADSRALDAVRQVEQHDAANAARTAGDRRAQSEPVPDPRLTVG